MPSKPGIPEKDGSPAENAVSPSEWGAPTILEGFSLRRDAPRPATILKCADTLESRGGEVLELFREVTTPVTSAVFPIHFLDGEDEYFVEVETGPWIDSVRQATIRRAAVLRTSSSAEAGLGVLSAYPVPEEVTFLVTRSPAALLELDLYEVTADDPETAAEAFRSAAGARWGTDLRSSVEYLPLVEELLLSTFAESSGETPVLEGLVNGLGCFLGETIRRGFMGGKAGMWSTDEEWGEGVVLDIGGFTLDPVGKARAFLENGADDSLTFYAGYVTEALDEDRRDEADDASQE